MVFIALLVSFIPTTLFADSFGPDEWNQYRYSSDKNAVYDNDSEPLSALSYDTLDEVRATPVIVGNRLFIGNHNTGDLFAFDIENGEQIWSAKAPNWIHSEMIYQDGRVFVGFGNRFFQENGIRGTEESGVLALDAETGEVLWKYNTDGEVMPTPVVYKESVYIVTGDKTLYKINPNNGELVHKSDIGSVISMSSPAVHKNTLFFGGGRPTPYTFSAYSLKKDEFVWQTEFPKVIAGLDDVPPAVHGNLVVTTALEGNRETPEHFMYALNRKNGKIVWKKSLGKGEMVSNNKSGAPMIYDNKIYVGSPITKTFYAYDLKTGEQIWKYKNEVMKAPPVAQNGIVYFSNTLGYVYALDADSGEELGKKKLNGKLAPAGPVIVNDTLFVGSQDSKVYRLPLTDIINEDVLASKAKSNSMQFYIIGLLIVVLIGLLFIALKRRR